MKHGAKAHCIVRLYLKRVFHYYRYLASTGCILFKRDTVPRQDEVNIPRHVETHVVLVTHLEKEIESEVDKFIHTTTQSHISSF